MTSGPVPLHLGLSIMSSVTPRQQNAVVQVRWLAKVRKEEEGPLPLAMRSYLGIERAEFLPRRHSLDDRRQTAHTYRDSGSVHRRRRPGPLPREKVFKDGEGGSLAADITIRLAGLSYWITNPASSVKFLHLTDNRGGGIGFGGRSRARK